MVILNDSEVKIKDDIYWIGGDDRTASIFEGSFPLPEGVSYNSYIILDEKTCLLDTCDISISSKFWKNLRHALNGRQLDYLVINHMEPDHGAAIVQVLDTYPDVTVVGNSKTFDMLDNFYQLQPKNKLEVKEYDELCLGKHTLRFVFAVMIHWPEVMFTYDIKDKILFSADAFGTFKTLSGALYSDEVDFDRDYLDEARRYYANIVGKYGSKVQSVFNKLENVPIDMICPLHGPIWRNENIGYIMEKYFLWSTYEPEEKGVVIGYSSMYGNTAAAVDKLAMLLKAKGVENITMYDVTRVHPSYVVGDAFRFSNIVLAAPTYNNNLHPTMSAVLEEMEIMAVQNRKYSVIGNGSWVPQAPKILEDRLAAMKNMTKVGETLTIKSSLRPEQLAELDKLADDIVLSLQ
ncbi:MAG: FprA family A-type flavoprotein [Candidatus Methanomethylophilaceae archaeon]|nr:FprA family A-type flavoprotein [Candidatus Methanomethylophilaceae archaeon]